MYFAKLLRLSKLLEGFRHNWLKERDFTTVEEEDKKVAEADDIISSAGRFELLLILA